MRTGTERNVIFLIGRSCSGARNSIYYLSSIRKLQEHSSKSGRGRNNVKGHPGKGMARMISCRSNRRLYLVGGN